MSQEQKIYGAIIAVMRKVGAITKDKRNTQQGFMFRGIDDVYNALHPLMAEAGVFSVPEVLESETEERTTQKGATLIYEKYRIKYTFFAEDGSSITATVKGIGMDSGDKAGNKAMAIAHKYALLQVFAIPTADMVDPDAESHPELKPRQARAVKATPAASNEATGPSAQKPQVHESSLLVIMGGAVEKTAKTGKKYYVVEAEEDLTGEKITASTFSDTLANDCNDLAGQKVILTYATNGKYRNAVSVELHAPNTKKEDLPYA